MKMTLKDLIQRSGKKREVSFKNKSKRTSLDQNFGKNKLEIATKFISSEENAIALANKLG